MMTKNINIENHYASRMAEEYNFLFKICIFGDNDVGKKTFFKLIYPGFDEKMTSINIIGVDFCSKKINTLGVIKKLQFWIDSDSERFKFLIPNHLSGSNGIILIYDITNPNSLNYLSEVLQSATNFREKYNVPILLVGNKSDLKENREISEEQIKKFKIENKISNSMEISLKTGKNVERMVRRITRMALEGREPILPLKKREPIPYNIPTFKPLRKPKRFKSSYSDTGSIGILLVLPFLYLLTFIGNIIKDLDNFALTIAWGFILLGLIITLVAYVLIKRKKS